MPDYIKRIQSRLSSKGVSLTRQEITAQLEVEPTEDNIDSLVNELLSNQQSVSLQKVTRQPETAITVTEQQKENLVLQTSNSLGITLVGSEVKQISKSISSQFSDRREMLKAITNAIQAFTQHIVAQEQEIINEALNNVQNTLSNSNKAVKDTFNNLERDIHQSNLDFKSIQTDILELFAIN
jgi:hypothetical protein